MTKYKNARGRAKEFLVHDFGQHSHLLVDHAMVTMAKGQALRDICFIPSSLKKGATFLLNLEQHNKIRANTTMDVEIHANLWLV